MSSKEDILKAIKKNKPEKSKLPEISNFKCEEDQVEKFKSLVEFVGGEFIVFNSEVDVEDWLKSNHGEDKVVFKGPDVPDFSPEVVFKSEERAGLQTVVLCPQLAVAENGALWYPEERIGERVFPFICEKLISIVRRSKLVPKMHDAYDQIGEDDYGFGVFISGPSKTADIEQSLVIGAHGPLAHTVLFVED